MTKRKKRLIGINDIENGWNSTINRPYTYPEIKERNRKNNKYNKIKNRAELLLRIFGL